VGAENEKSKGRDYRRRIAGWPHDGKGSSVLDLPGK